MTGIDGGGGVEDMCPTSIPILIPFSNPNWAHNFACQRHTIFCFSFCSHWLDTFLSEPVCYRRQYAMKTVKEASNIDSLRCLPYMI